MKQKKKKNILKLTNSFVSGHHLLKKRKLKILGNHPVVTNLTVMSASIMCGIALLPPPSGIFSASPRAFMVMVPGSHKLLSCSCSIPPNLAILADRIFEAWWGLPLSSRPAAVARRGLRSVGSKPQRLLPIRTCISTSKRRPMGQ